MKEKLWEEKWNGNRGINKNNNMREICKVNI